MAALKLASQSQQLWCLAHATIVQLQLSLICRMPLACTTCSAWACHGTRSSVGRALMELEQLAAWAVTWRMSMLLWSLECEQVLSGALCR